MRTSFKLTTKRLTYELDASNKRLGRVATQAAILLQGKHKPTYSPHLDCGDRVVITNVKYLDIPPSKLEQKIYWRHSGYPGGIKGTPLKKKFNEDPAWVVRTAVRNMLPKNKLRRQWLKRLVIREGPLEKTSTAK